MTTADERGKMNRILVDPAIVNKRSETNAVTADQVAKKLAIKITAANNDRISGWNNVRGFLKVYDDPNSGKKTSILKICSNCENLIRTLPEQLHDDSKVEDIDTNGEDHAVDALRY